eukprot:COSAG01_NODE_7858_length_3024_cov_1.660171_2_plen_91_part_01
MFSQHRVFAAAALTAATAAACGRWPPPVARAVACGMRAPRDTAAVAHVGGDTGVLAHHGPASDMYMSSARGGPPPPAPPPPHHGPPRAGGG